MSDAILDDVVTMLFMPWVVALVFSLVALERSAPVIYIALGFALLVGLSVCAVRLVRKLRKRSRFRLGLEGEMATGEELNQLMLRGCRVFHDFPAKSSNIDHVVIGHGGVFAVETKTRGKPRRHLGKVDARVTYDGKALTFPGWQESEPLEQAVRQARWLARWLTSAVGEPVEVEPALALPGWFVDRRAPGDVIVFSPTELVKAKRPFLTEPRRGKPELPTQLIDRIAHQVEQRCRDVAPKELPDRSREWFKADRESD